MKVSVITYCYISDSNDRLKLLEKALDSVAVQKFGDYEHIVVDDGSGVDLKTVVSMYPNTRYIRKARSGIISSTATYNLGFSEAKGDYAIILSSDDYQTKDCLNCLSRELDENPQWVAALGGAIIQRGPDEKYFLPTVENHYENLINVGNHINGCAIMFRMDVFQSRGQKLPPDITSFCADYDMWVRVAESGSIGIVDVPVVVYCDHSDATRHKTRAPRTIPILDFDKSYYPFSKPSRLNFVKESSKKRLSNKTVSLDGSLLVVGEYDQYLTDFKSIKTMTLKEAPEVFNFDFSSKNRRKELSEKYSVLKEQLSAFAEIKLFGLSDSVVLASYLVVPEQKVSWYCCEFVRDNLYADMLNWAMVDEIIYFDKSVLARSVDVLGLSNYVESRKERLADWISG